MPRAVQRATAADVPYSMSSGCATTQSTRRKDSSGRAGNAMPAILPELFPAGDGQSAPRSACASTSRSSLRCCRAQAAASDRCWPGPPPAWPPAPQQPGRPGPGQAARLCTVPAPSATAGQDRSRADTSGGPPAAAHRAGLANAALRRTTPKANTKHQPAALTPVPPPRAPRQPYPPDRTARPPELPVRLRHDRRFTSRRVAPERCFCDTRVAKARLAGHRRHSGRCYLAATRWPGDGAWFVVLGARRPGADVKTVQLAKASTVIASISSDRVT